MPLEDCCVPFCHHRADSHLLVVKSRKNHSRARTGGADRLQSKECTPDGVPETRTFHFGLKVKFTWSGAKKTERGGNVKNKGQGKRAVHIEFEKGLEKRGHNYARRALKLEEFKARCNLQMRIIPLFRPAATRAVKEKTQWATLRHAQISASLNSGETDCCQDTDCPIEELGECTLRMLILGVKWAGTDERLFISIDCEAFF